MTLRFLTAGESHGPALTAIIEGLPAGLPLSAEDIDRELARRQQGYGRGGRMAIERDRVQITGGVIAGQTIGAPVSLIVENRDWANWQGRETPAWTVPRPGHADLAGAVKYGLSDMRWVAERASARETTMRVAVGAVCKGLLRQLGVEIGSYVAELGGVSAAVPDLPWPELWSLAEASDVRCPDAAAAEQMRAEIDAARRAGDSLGGVLVVAAVGAPVGLGSHVHWDRRLDARLAQAIMSIPAIKGVEIGPAFANARLRGTEVHDALYPAGPGEGERFAAGMETGPTDRLSRDAQSSSGGTGAAGGVIRRTNRAGGVEGGMSNGAPIVIRAAMKPIPTTVSPQPSVDRASGQAAETRYQRSDVCALPAACVVAEAMLAWVLADAVLEKFGGDSMAELLQRVRP